MTLAAPVSHTVSRSIVEATELPRIIRVRPNFHVAAFGLMKLLPARFMLDRAEERGEVGPGTTVLETSSGTFGLGLAMVCRLRGYPLTIVGDPAIDAPLKRRLEHLGARVEICPKPSPVGGYQRARLDRLEELRAEYPNHWVPGQYSNPDNPRSYALVAEQLAETIGVPDCLVGAVGSGGSTSGTSSFLRMLVPELTLIGVDTQRSAIFGQPDGPRVLRGLGNSLVPPNVEHSSYDQVHWIGAAEAFAATRELYARHCLFMGPTSGASFKVADWFSRRNPDATVVALLPDEGYRYQDTVYSDEWLRAQGLAHPGAAEPYEVVAPTEPGGSWTWLNWGRRPLGDVS
ncbi:pyridoxal-phosphate dependent enzyme [Amycolatopsis sp. FBCC-B4732]|uniref:pyridoxal-phosphate dependent enzyme n=1 Tax=Amycolatopsis sp. FBCC-B4732 TaxID=3079339 RepID=UPI001FF214E8|nr:pyridoxal-phosphate dependent enzyme [Amycolatopsis sp. FBCC-B4732]UOX91996.1 pyridoxal-phosphate dependent enzyme [Amycolatopsis sp. FBCC-B4732]